jgi:hypothetical protein
VPPLGAAHACGSLSDHHPDGFMGATGVAALPAPGTPAPPVLVQDERTQCPQSGVWVGAAATVDLRSCTIARCMGPGIKIYRGRLFARSNSIAFSSRGANVVANGGRVTLDGNEITGANGDGVSCWNSCDMIVTGNRIHANSGSGIAVNTGFCSVTIRHNSVFDNECQGVLFATTKKHILGSDSVEAENKIHDNNKSQQQASAREGGPMPPLIQRTPSGSSSMGSSGGSLLAAAAPHAPPPMPMEGAAPAGESSSSSSSSSSGGAAAVDAAHQ